MKFLFSLLLSLLSLSLFSQDFPGESIIGRGYDIFGEYANSKSIKRYPIFDLQRTNSRKNTNGYNIPKIVLLEKVAEHQIRTIEGANQIEYASNLSKDIGIGGNAFFFKAALETSFETDLSLDVSSYYYTYMDVNEKWRISLDIRNFDTLRHYLDKQFEIDLKQLPPAEFFNIYGTHFVVGAYLGGRIDYSAKSSYYEGASKEKIEVAIKAKVLKITTSGDMTSSEEQILRKARSTEHLKVIGGKSEYKNNISDPEQYNLWAAGVEDMPVMCGFDKKGLMPIWKLSSDIKRQHILERYYFENILSEHPLPDVFLHDAVLDSENEIIQNFRVVIDRFIVHNDCDYPVLGDAEGEIVYKVDIYANEKHIGQVATPEGYVNPVWSGNDLVINKYADFSLPLVKNSEIKLEASIWEKDDLRIEDMGTEIMTHKYPFNTQDLYNAVDGEQYCWSEYFYNDSDCNATFVYRIEKMYDAAAINLGNEGWKAYETGDYDKALSYSKEALKIDNSLMYVHYNVALIYLIKRHPEAFS